MNPDQVTHPTFAGVRVSRSTGTRSIMTQQRNSERRTKAPQQQKAQRATRTSGSAATLTGRSAYRQDYERNYGPDLDEWLDATESGDAVQALAATS